jgi:GAF domain-containing protein
LVDCRRQLERNIFALIKELAEANATQIVTAIELDKQVERLTEENERLKEKADRHLDNLKAVLEERSENTIVADTVREIKTRFALRYGTYTDKYMTPITEVFWLLDRIANEILNNTEDEEK